MSDLRSLLERADSAVSRVPLPSEGFERLEHRRDRKRRNQRIAAGVVGIAVFVAAVSLVVVGGSFDRTQTPAAPGRALTGPAVTAPTERVGIIGLPPEGATPSTPESGEVVLRASARGLVCGSGSGMFCFVWVYADGRLIWIADAHLPYGANERTTGLLEQRLTPAGIELIVSEFTSAGGCSAPSDPGAIDCSGAALLSLFPAISKHVGGVPVGTDPTWGLPAGAWEDPEVRAFVPSRFGACFQHAVDYPELYLDLTGARVLDWIPSSAADVLRGKEMELPQPGQDDGDSRCFALTTEEARAVSERLDEAVIERDGGYEPYGLAYQLVGPNRFPEPELLMFPGLPSGELVYSGYA